MSSADSHPRARQDGETPSAIRWLVLAGMVLSVVVAYMARAGLAPAGKLIQDELGLSNTALGAIHGVWAIGYVGFQLPGGWLGDRFGRRTMLSLYGLVWSCCTLATANAFSFAGLWWSRLIFGMAQAGLVPCLTAACVDWIPDARRGSASAAITAGMSAGAVAAVGLSAMTVPALGWRVSLDLFAILSVAWSIGFWLIFRELPQQHPWVNASELALIRQDQDRSAQAREANDSQPARAYLAPDSPHARWNERFGVYASRAFLMLCAQAVCRSFCYAFLISWFPSYLERAHGLHIASASVMSMLPLAGVAAGAIMGGVVIDQLLRITASKWISRSMVAAVAMVVAGVGPLLAIGVVHAGTALVILAVGAAFSGLAAPATWAATMDVGGRSSTSVMAFINMAGNLGAFLCPVAVGGILDLFPERWGLVLLMFGIVSICGGVCWLLVDPDRASHERASVVPKRG
jgi:MFS family permease